MSIALIPGSFDPMTIGHLDLVKHARSLYDEVIVAVMINPKKQYAHTMEERTEMAKLTVAGLDRVRVVSSTGLLIDLFDELGADVIVKGVRNEADRQYEEEMAKWNVEHNPRAKTVLLQAADDFEEISSSGVRELLESGAQPDEMVVPAVAAYLRAKRGEK